eukprot:7050053-Pyramimonas_sp.AAC.1
MSRAPFPSKRQMVIRRRGPRSRHAPDRVSFESRSVAWGDSQTTDARTRAGSPTNLVGRWRQVLPAAQRGASCPVDHPYRGPLLSKRDAKCRDTAELVGYTPSPRLGSPRTVTRSGVPDPPQAGYEVYFSGCR